jgi:predicted ArsR family transcriptional regulator
MATAPSPTSIEQIGETAGLVWRALSENGPLSLAKLAKEVDVPKELVLQAIGWLAREDKIHIEDGRTKIISLI